MSAIFQRWSIILIILAIFFFILLRLPYLFDIWDTNVHSSIILPLVFVDAEGRQEIEISNRELNSFQARVYAKLNPNQTEILMNNSFDMLNAFSLCTYYWENGRRAEAITACRQGNVPGQTWVEKGLGALQSDDNQKAIGYFELAVATDPDLASGYNFLGRELYKQKAYAEAIPIFETVIRLDQGVDASHYNQLGQSLIQTDEPAIAQKVLREGISRFPNVPTLYLSLAEAFEEGEELTQADDWYGLLLEKWPDNSQAWSRRGDLAYKQEKWDEAATYLQTAVLYQPDALGDWSKLARAAEERGDMALASEAHETIMELAPTNINLWLTAGKFYVKQAQNLRARQIFEYILRLDPASVEAQNQLEKLSEE